jgi:hypothetical protein
VVHDPHQEFRKRWNVTFSYGPLTRFVLEGSKPSVAYPDTQSRPGEYEQLFSFAQVQGVLDEYLPRLRGNARQHSAALAEIRVARYFSLNGYKPQRDTRKPNGARTLMENSKFRTPAASDLDLIVELDPETFANYASLTEFLEGLFGCRVDLVMKDAIKPALRGSIFRESVEAARL